MPNEGVGGISDTPRSDWGPHVFEGFLLTGPAASTPFLFLLIAYPQQLISISEEVEILWVSQKAGLFGILTGLCPDLREMHIFHKTLRLFSTFKGLDRMMKFEEAT